MKMKMYLMVAALACAVSATAFAQKAVSPATVESAGVNVEMPQRPLEDAEYRGSRQNEHWCATDMIWQERAAELRQWGWGNGFKRAGCPLEGNCDVPSVRDAANTQAKTIDVIVHVMRDSSGNGGVSQATVDATMAQMNSDFAQANIQFNLKATRFHNDNSYSCISAYSFSGQWQNDINNMKLDYAETPDQNINIFISCQDSGGFGVLLGIATFPWDPEVLSQTGGLWLNNIAVGAGAHTATHEMGHCLGLWHTHHGVSEVSSCGDCYEFANGFEGDIRGDFADDTPPTPTNYNCSGPGGSDCQGTSWGGTQPENFMGYGPDSCMDLFTPKQISRLHCWTDDVLTGWLGGGVVSNQAPTASFTYSTNNLAVDVDGSGSSDSDGTIASYAWDFGDGSTGSGATASHTYASSGTYTVSLTVTDDDGAVDSTTQDVTVSDGSTGGGITLSGSGYKVKGRHNIDLTWSGANGSTVDIYRDGSLIATTANDGSYTDSTNNRGGATYVYEVCEAGSSTCSNTETIVF